VYANNLDDVLALKQNIHEAVYNIQQSEIATISPKSI
jgi:hypothetical protein